MSEWRNGKIGELATGIRGVSYTPEQLKEFKNSDTITLLRSNNIQSGWLQFKNIQIVPKSVVSEAQILRFGDIAICMSNGSKALVGKAGPFVNITNEQFTVGAFCSIFRPASGVDCQFTKYIFQSSAYRAQLDISLAGSAINNLRNSEIELFSIKIPPPEHQKKIAEVLDVADVTIRQTEAIIEKLKLVKQGLLHDLLTRGIDANGELRPPQSQAPHLYKDSPLGWIPTSWCTATLGEIAEIRSGTTPARSSSARYYCDDGIPWVKTMDLNEGDIQKTSESITAVALRECSCERLPVGSVLIAMYGGWEQIGRTGILQTPAATNQAISALIFTSADLEPEYVLRAVQHGRKRWAGVAASTRKDPNITKGDVQSFRIALPNARSEQKEIVRIVSAALAKITLEIAGLHKMMEEKAGLMDDLLTGRVRVTPLLEPLGA